MVTRTTTYDMSPEKWHYRVPFFGKVGGRGVLEQSSSLLYSCHSTNHPSDATLCQCHHRDESRPSAPTMPAIW